MKDAHVFLIFVFRNIVVFRWTVYSHIHVLAIGVDSGLVNYLVDVRRRWLFAAARHGK